MDLPRELTDRLDAAETARQRFDIARDHFLKMIKNHHRLSNADPARENREIEAALTKATEALLVLAVELDGQMS